MITPSWSVALIKFPDRSTNTGSHLFCSDSTVRIFLVKEGSGAEPLRETIGNSSSIPNVKRGPILGLFFEK